MSPQHDGGGGGGSGAGGGHLVEWLRHCLHGSECDRPKQIAHVIHLGSRKSVHQSHHLLRCGTVPRPAPALLPAPRRLCSTAAFLAPHGGLHQRSAALQWICATARARAAKGREQSRHPARVILSVAGITARTGAANRTRYCARPCCDLLEYQRPGSGGAPQMRQAQKHQH